MFALRPKESKLATDVRELRKRHLRYARSMQGDKRIRAKTSFRVGLWDLKLRKDEVTRRLTFKRQVCCNHLRRELATSKSHVISQASVDIGRSWFKMSKPRLKRYLASSGLIG